MKNYIVVHNYKQHSVSRFDYGEDYEAAMRYADKLWATYKDMKNANLHEIIVIEEFSQEIVKRLRDRE